MSEWKETEFGKIPIDWDSQIIDKIKSQEKYAISMGPFGSNITSDNFRESGVPIIRGNNLNTYKFFDQDFVYVSEEKADALRSSNCRRGDLVFTHRGTLGQIGLIPQNSNYHRYIISQSGMKLTVDQTKIDNVFLFYFFKSKYGQYQLLKNESQVGVPSIGQPLTSLKEMEVPIPPIPEQKAIAGILSSLDDKIDLLHRNNKTLEAMAETIFRQWFIEGASEEWEIGKFGDCIDIYDSKRIPLSSIEREKMKDGVLYPYYGAATIMDYINRYIFDGEYILMGEDGTVETKEGFPVLQFVSGQFWVNNHTHVLQSREPFSNYYIYNYLKKLNISSIITGAVQPKINQENLKGLEFLIPPITLVETFNTVTKPILGKIQSNNKKIHTLEALRNTLLPKLISGELRVPV